MPSCAADSASDGYADDGEDCPKRGSGGSRHEPAVNVDGTPMVTAWTDANGAAYGMPRSWNE